MIEGSRVELINGIRGYINKFLIHIDMAKGTQRHEIWVLTDQGVLQKGLKRKDVKKFID